jgi:diguanylate cyclase
MRNKIAKIGRTGIVTLITIFSVIASVVITVAILILFSSEVEPLPIFISIIAPAIIAPTVSWYMVGLVIKIHQLEMEMRTLATYDTLTGVMTRGAFLSNIESIYQIIRRNKSSLSLVYIDIDDFKKINDTYGHPGGDAVLKSFSSIIKKCNRKSDLVGRIGGEEFAIALPDTGLDGSIQISNKIRLLAKNTRVKYSSKTIQYTVSIGVALFGQENQIDLEQLIRQSDNALYKAKSSGKDCVMEYKANN